MKIQCGLVFSCVLLLGVLYWGKYDLREVLFVELGQRLKQARLEKGLSQKALCADVITRNMLSQIESGKAKPSMETLKYLAARLEKPVGYFLEEQAVLSPNQQIMADARQAYQAGEYRKVLSVLESYRPGDLFDHEKQLICNLCLLAMGEQAIRENRLIYARELLHRIEPGLYHLPGMDYEKALLLNRAGETAQIPADDRGLLERALQAFSRGDHSRSITLLEAVEQRAPRWYLLRGRVAAAQGDYQTAAACLSRAEEAFPKETIPLLERCYRELEDYKQAYEYACKNRQRRNQ